MRIGIHDYAGHPFQIELSRELARRGHVVSHFYYQGDKGPKGRVTTTPDDPANFTITPVDIGREYVKSNFVQRAVYDQAYGRALTKAICDFAPDIVISANTPLEAQRHLSSAVHRMGAKYVFWMQDFYSLAIERILSRRWLGAGALVSKYYKALERSFLQASDSIVLISPDFTTPLASFALRDPKIEVIPNWAPISDLPVRPKINPWSIANGLSDKFVFLYSGTLALKHNPQLLRALAERFVGRPDVVIAVAAHGVGRDELEKSQLANQLPNLRIFDLQPVETLPDMLGTADVCLALLEVDAGEFSVPSKVLSYYCSGRPLLLAAPTSNLASKTTQAIGAGMVCDPDDMAAFVQAAEQLYSDAERRSLAGAAARLYAEENFEITRLGDRFEQMFLDLVGQRETRPGLSWGPRVKHQKVLTP